MHLLSAISSWHGLPAALFPSSCGKATGGKGDRGHNTGALRAGITVAQKGPRAARQNPRCCTRKAASALVVLKYLETALQVADMFTKQIFPKHFERLRRVMMGHENFDDMQARYVQVKASGDDMDDPKLYVDSKPGRPPK